jgi:hypothetical protein
MGAQAGDIDYAGGMPRKRKDAAEPTIGDLLAIEERGEPLPDEVRAVIDPIIRLLDGLTKPTEARGPDINLTWFRTLLRSEHGLPANDPRPYARHDDAVWAAAIQNVEELLAKEMPPERALHTVADQRHLSYSTLKKRFLKRPKQ